MRCARAHRRGQSRRATPSRSRLPAPTRPDLSAGLHSSHRSAGRSVQQQLRCRSGPCTSRSKGRGRDQAACGCRSPTAQQQGPQARAAAAGHKSKEPGQRLLAPPAACSQNAAGHQSPGATFSTISTISTISTVATSSTVATVSTVATTLLRQGDTLNTPARPAKRQTRQTLARRTRFAPRVELDETDRSQIMNFAVEFETVPVEGFSTQT